MSTIIGQTYNMYEVQTKNKLKLWLPIEDTTYTPVIVSSTWTDVKPVMWAQDNVHEGMTTLCIGAAPGYLWLLLARLTGSGRSWAAEYRKDWREALDQTLKVNPTLNLGLLKMSDTESAKSYERMALQKPDVVFIDTPKREQTIWYLGAQLWAAEKPPVVVMKYHPNAVNDKLVLPSLLDYGRVTMIDYQGKEQEVTSEFVTESPGEVLLVIRRY